MQLAFACSVKKMPEEYLMSDLASKYGKACQGMRFFQNFRRFETISVKLKCHFKVFGREIQKYGDVSQAMLPNHIILLPF